MNGIYRKNVSLSVAFYSAAKNLECMPTVSTEIAMCSHNKNRWGKAIIRKVAKKAYCVFKPILRPIFFRLRQYFLDSLQHTINIGQEQNKKNIANLERQLASVLQELHTLRNAIDTGFEGLQKMTNVEREDK